MEWYKSKDGVPTGGPESSSIANIYVKYVLDEEILPDPRISQLNKIKDRVRFLDDIFFKWLGNIESFELFKSVFNAVGRNFNFSVKGEVGQSVEFLYTVVSIEDKKLNTKIFIKPTDSPRYLNRRSDHSAHTFRAIPFSQFRRAVVICSKEKDKIECIEYMVNKFKDSGYKEDELLEAREKAMNLDRMVILKNENKKTVNEDILTLVINHDRQIKNVIQKYLNDNSKLIEKWIGEKR